MSNRWSFTSADRASRRLFVPAALAGAALLSAPFRVEAATALVQWRPAAAAAVTHYDVYVRDGGTPHDALPVWSGNPATAADGSMSAVVTYTPAPTGVSYFAMVAVSNGQESGLSRELPVGTPDPCHADSCVTKTSCDFQPLPDGTSCEEGVLGDGSEVCRAGACTPVAFPSCPACDGSDPCLTDACAAGDCTADSGVDVRLDRFRFTTGKPAVGLSLKGRIDTGPAIDPSVTGAILELRTADGALLHWLAVAPERFRAQASGGRYQFTAPRGDADPSWNGLERLGFRRKGPSWIVTAQLKSAALADAAREPTITLVIRSGSTCARRLDARCEQRSKLSICR